MYYQVILECVRSLENLKNWIDKTEQYAEENEIDIAEIMNGRLAKDMRPFIYQVQSACDYMKAAAAWLSGQKPPRHEDNEQTVDEVRARIDKTIAYVNSIKKEQYEGASERTVSLSWMPGKIIGGEDYLLQLTIPNIYFHISMAYAILRNKGVPVGKMDFLGQMRFVDV